MHDDSVLVAIDEALRSPAGCACGNSLEVTIRDSAVWLECQSFGRPSRLPPVVASFLRELVHDRRLVIEIPAEQAPVPGAIPSSVRSARPLTLRA